MTGFPRGVSARLRFGVAVACILVAGCSKGDELTREIAAEKIGEALKGEERTYSLTNDGFELGTKLGYWSTKGVLTEKGQKIASAVSATNLTTATPPMYAIEVTGITDAAQPQGAKEALFNLSNASAQGPVRYFIVAGGTGKALFKKYDDGWRLENPKTLKVDVDRAQPLTLSKAEETAMTRERHEAVRKELDRVGEASKVTERHTFECAIGNQMTAVTTRLTLTITNSSVEFSNSSSYDGTVLGVWFGDVAAWRSELGFMMDSLLVETTGKQKYNLYFSRCRDYRQVIELFDEKYGKWKSQYPDFAKT